MVLGAGIVGLTVIAALRALGSKSRIVVLSKYPFQTEAAQNLAANDVLMINNSPHFYESVAQAVNGRVLKPSFGKPIMVGGADFVFECVGSDDSINDALNFSASGGTVILLGTAAIPTKVDWTPNWLNELQVKGGYGSATEMYQGRSISTYQLALDLIAEGRVDLSPLVTHRFRLADYGKALATAADKGRNGVLKAVFVFD